ncbi:MAG: GIY-YIG nuclease family protein [Candidatus Marinimicrobia bacterium]|nr:GIY-YIG nuclease family protein [Candidatus Neomarinimicrobiota bacterium]
MSETYHLYILHSKTLGRYYTGISHDPETRLHYHNTSHKGWTCRGRPWKLMFLREFANRDSAFKAERFVKAQKSSNFITRLISGEFTLDP